MFMVDSKENTKVQGKQIFVRIRTAEREGEVDQFAPGSHSLKGISKIQLKIQAHDTVNSGLHLNICLQASWFLLAAQVGIMI